MKTWVGRLLLAFAIFTLGYGLGKEAGLRRGRAETPPPPPTPAATGDQVVVYYLHATFRCEICNNIELQTRAVVEGDFAAAVQQGRVVLRVANFQEREDLAQRYQVASSTVVVAHIVGGQEVAHQRLDEVWTLHGQPDRFAAYLGGVIRGYLGEAQP